MLVVTRRKGESLIIRDTKGNYVGRVHVSLIRGERVRIGVDLPHDFYINRDEVDTDRFPDNEQPPALFSTTEVRDE